MARGAGSGCRPLSSELFNPMGYGMNHSQEGSTGNGGSRSRSVVGLSWQRENLLSRLKATWPPKWHKLKTGVSTRTLNAVLHEIWLRCDRGAVAACFAFDHEIAKSIGLEVGQVNKATLLLVKLGFLCKDVLKARRRTLRNKFAIEWTTVENIVTGRAAFPLAALFGTNAIELAVHASNAA